MLQEKTFMRRVLFLFVMALALPSVVWANSINVGNSAGVLSGSSAGLTTSTASFLTSWNGHGGSYGTLTFTTGALSSGSLTAGGVFAGGGSFVMTGNSGTIFSGTFEGPVLWTLYTDGLGNHYYTLSGTLTGTWFTGAVLTGATTQLTVPVGKGFFSGTAALSGGSTTFTAVPEPGTLGLLGTGLITLAGAIRRKFVT
jgi:PEP-CTERM motif